MMQLTLQTNSSIRQLPFCVNITQASTLGNSDRGYKGAYMGTGTLEAESPVPFSAQEADALSRGVGTESPHSCYKDLLAKPATATKSACGAWAVVADCSSGKHHFAKKLVCGKEWCEVCGQDQSAAHKRRQARILPKLQQVSVLGYFVIEWPDIYRHIGERGFNPDLDGGEYIAGWCYSKADLRDTTNTIVNVLAGKRCGRRGRVGGYFKRGLCRWHWYGDELPGKWNPHLNVLVDGGHLELELLETIKSTLRSALACPGLIVHYSYFDKPGQMVQKARYLTRPTFQNYDWNPYMANELWNFRNMRWWGNWKGEPVWELSEAEKEGEDVAGLRAVSKLQEGICPDCGEPLKVLRTRHDKKGNEVEVRWSRPVDGFYLDIWQATEIAGSGYYRIPHREWRGYSFSPGELLRLERLEMIHRAGVKAVADRAKTEARVEAKYRANLYSDLCGNAIQEGGDER